MAGIGPARGWTNAGWFFERDELKCRGPQHLSNARRAGPTPLASLLEWSLQVARRCRDSQTRASIARPAPATLASPPNRRRFHNRPAARRCRAEFPAAV